MNTLIKRLPPSIKKLKLAKIAYNLIEEHTTFLRLKIYYLKMKIQKKNKLVVLCYPETPSYYHTLYNICGYSGHKLTNKPQKADCIMYFHDVTIRKPDPVIKSLNKDRKVINYNSRDIRKSKIDSLHKKIFGYGLTVNPLTVRGEYIRKGDLNSTHDGKILIKKVKPEKGFIYQRLVDNTRNGKACDIRLPIFRNNIPFAYLKYRPLNMRFSDDYTEVKIVKTKKVISDIEYNKIIRLCKSAGLEYGELDALRDRKTGRLYVVDVNNTPAGPSFFLSYKQKLEALKILSGAFNAAFLSNN